MKRVSRVQRVCSVVFYWVMRKRSIWFSLLAFLSTFICLFSSTFLDRGLAVSPAISQPLMAQAQTLEQQAQQLYQAGQYPEAIEQLQQAIRRYEAEGDRLKQAVALSNLALVYQQQGAWTEANQAIEQSLTLLQSQSDGEAAVLAQVFNIQGGLQLAQGQAQAALESWQQAASFWEQANDLEGTTRATLNQTQALQALGLYRQAIDRLIALNQTLQPQPDSLIKVTALRSLGDALLVSGSLSQARTALEQSLSIAQSLGSAAPTQEALAAIDLSLGNLTLAEAVAQLNLSNLTPTEAIDRLNTTPASNLNPTEQVILRRQKEAAEAFYQQAEVALTYYQQAAEGAISTETRLQAKLNQLKLLVATDRQDAALSLYPQIQTELDQQPSNRATLYHQIDLVQSANQLRSAPLRDDLAQRLATVNQSAQAIGDVRAQSYALGNLGALYEQAQQWQEAQSLTEQALAIAQSINATDIAYQWQWQLGRLLRAQNQTESAILSYQEAVNSLQTLRQDLVAVNRDVQFSFREQVEPVYRQFVELLLQAGNPDAVKLDRLIQARDVIEGLQIAELDNFFREACLDTQFQLDRVVDQENLSAAIFYTIVLPDRLEVILKLPQQPLVHYSTEVAQSTVEQTADRLLIELRRPFASRNLETLSTQLYDWLIRPAAPALQTSNVSTLVFVLDGALRSVPMAALYDGEQYLLDQYSVALAPGLQLPDPKPLQPQDIRALVAGLSEARDDFPPLNFVAQEIEEIQDDVPSQVLFNQDFTRDNLQQLIESNPFPIVHIATHGQFSSNAADTFILTWDQRIKVSDFNALLQTQDLTNLQPIELLVLSACQTAVGDRRATLGLAGVAVRAGARSTIASLWNLDDASGALLMSQFYQELANPPISRAEALRRAQLSLRSDPLYASPRFWAPYVLLGNWL